MPFYLKESDILSQVAGLQSVLIVPCRFCPAASLAVDEQKPYIEPLRRFLRTEAYESFIRNLKRRLEENGTSAVVFDAKLPHHFVGCMWTSGRRTQLGKRAAGFDGVVVLGCDAMVETVCGSVAPDDCRVVQGMVAEGIMNVIPKVRFPFSISLEVQGMTPVIMKNPRPVESHPTRRGPSAEAPSPAT